MCNCISEVEKRITEAIQKQNPGAIVTDVELQNKGLLFTKNDSLRVTLEFEGKLNVSTKSGAIRAKKVKQTMVLSKCPFCGVEYEND